MSKLPSAVDPLDRAIVELLCRLSPRWEQYEPDTFGSAEQRAAHLMVLAGLIEIRLHIRAQMDHQPESLEMTVTVSGQYDARTLWQTALRHVPQWFDSEGRTRDQCHLWSQPQQIRLTDQGELARHDYENQTPESPSSVCAFVRRAGFFANRPDVEARIRIEHAECTSTAGVGSAPAAQIVAAQATASASIGDITIQNHINIDAGQVAEAVIAKVKDQAQTGNAKDRAQAESTTETPPADDVLTEADILESTQYGGPIEDEYDDRFAKWMGKRLYLGRDTQASRLFWLLARPLGRARRIDEVQIAVDGMITDDSIDSPPEEIRKAALRVRKAVSKLRARMRDDGFDDHLVIHRDGGNECPEYTMVRRF